MEGWRVIVDMAKHTLLADTVLRRDGAGDLYLMNRQDHGWSSYAYSVKSEAWFLEHYNARLGEWSRDEHGEFCPVTRLPRSEQPTLHDSEEPPDLVSLYYSDREKSARFDEAMIDPQVVISDPDEPWSPAAIDRVLRAHPEIIGQMRGRKP